MTDIDATTPATIEELYAADQKWRAAKEILRDEIRRRVEAELGERLAELKAQRDLLSYKLLMQGVKKSVIGREGLSSSSPSTYAESINAGRRIAEGDESLDPLTAIEKPKALGITWTNDAKTTLKVTLGSSEKLRAAALSDDLERADGGLFLVEDDGFIEPHTPDMSIPAVLLWFRDGAFKEQVEAFVKNNR